MGGMFIPGRGRFALVLVALAALFAFVYSLANHAPVGVIAFTSVYLAVVAINVVRWWRGHAHRAAPAPRSPSPSDS